MPVYAHNLLSLRGTFEAGGVVHETWSINLRFGQPGTAWDITELLPFDQDATNNLHAAYATYHNNSEARISQQCKFVEARTYSIGTNGKATDAPVISNFDPVVGYTGGKNHPSQISLVSTFVAPGIGKGRLGRVYLPGPTHDVGLDWGCVPAQINSSLALWKDQLTTMNGIANNANCTLSIIGRTGGGTIRKVETVRMGRVLDTMRSRRRSLEEEPQAYAVG